MLIRPNPNRVPWRALPRLCQCPSRTILLLALQPIVTQVLLELTFHYLLRPMVSPLRKTRRSLPVVFTLHRMDHHIFLLLAPQMEAFNLLVALIRRIKDWFTHPKVISSSLRNRDALEAICSQFFSTQTNTAVTFNL